MSNSKGKTKEEGDLTEHERSVRAKLSSILAEQEVRPTRAFEEARQRGMEGAGIGWTAKHLNARWETVAFLEGFVKHLEPHMEGDGECLNGADAVDWLTGQYFKAKAILEKVEVGH